MELDAPHPRPLPASGEREGPAEREGEGRQPMELGRIGEENRLTGQPWNKAGLESLNL